MRKAVKALTIAASVAAVAGIGAVSFAKWSASTTPAEPTGKTGTVDTVGAVTLVTNSLGTPESGTAKTLVPYDQGTADGYDSASHVKVWKIGVKATYTGDAPTLEVAAGFGTDMNTTVTDAALYIYKGTDAIDDSNVASKVATSPSADTTNWQAITSSSKYEFTLTTSDTEQFVYIILDATGTAGMDTDLKATVGVKASA